MRSLRELVVAACAFGCFLLLVVPALTAAMDSNYNTICQANLKKIHGVAQEYHNDNGGYFPRLVNRKLKRWKFWNRFLLPYVKEPEIFYCPENPSVVQAGVYLDGPRSPLEPRVYEGQLHSYGMNHTMENRKVSDSLDPSRLIYFGDSKTPYLRGTKDCWEKDYAPRHGDAANFVTLDGSVKLMNYKSLGLLHKFGKWRQDKKRWSNWK